MSADIGLNLGGTTDMNIFALSVKQLRLGLFLCMGCIYTSRGVSLDYHELYRRYKIWRSMEQRCL